MLPTMLRIARRPALRAQSALPTPPLVIRSSSRRLLSTSDAPQNIFFTTRASALSWLPCCGVLLRC